MKYSKLFGKTMYGEVKQSKFISHSLLVKAGFIEESVAGRYFFLPLGWRVHDKIKAIIKDEMDKAGAQEMITPTLHPLELWEETNRTNTTGFELMKVSDRRGADFALGGTAEEMFVDVTRKRQLTYKDLPFNIYQFSNKFRDELRARGGLLRVREFIMKDAYSFHVDATDFKIEYDKMAEVYSRIFERVGLQTQMVAADNGYIGGEYCHEFQVEHPEGEGRYFVSEDGSYIAHEDVAEFQRVQMNTDEEFAEFTEIEAVRGNTMEDGVKLHNLPLWKQMKDVVMIDDTTGTMYLAIIRGDLDVNETKLQHFSGANQLRMATDEEIRAVGSEPGFISPVGFKEKFEELTSEKPSDDSTFKKCIIVADTSVRTVKNFYGGANKKNRDALNMNIDRDFKVDLEGDIGMAQAGFLTANGNSKLVEKRGIEVGNIFQLGYHYSEKMHNATFVDAEGSNRPYYMGCYGIGLGRTLATIIEKYHDDRGIIWPKSVAPYQVHLVSLKGGEEQAQNVYNQLLENGIEVLWDDREESAGTKFADADLIGLPVRLVVSKMTQDNVEYKERTSSESELLSFDALLEKLRD
jgi:prolyl-tRNA synthetase